MSGLLGQAALIVSGVVVARALGVEDRGNLALLIVVPLLLAQFGSLGLPVAATYEIARDPAIALPLLRRLAPLAGGLVMGLMVIHGGILVAIVSERGNEMRLAAIVTIVAIPAFVALQFGLAVMQGQQRYREFNLWRLAPAVLYAVLAVSLSAADYGTLPLLAACYAGAWLLVGGLVLALALAGSERHNVDRVDLPPTARLVKFGTRAVLGSASPSDGSGVDQAIVGFFLSTRLLGIYVVASAFMNLSRLVSQSIGLVAFPNVAARRNPRDAVRAMWRFTLAGAAAALAITIVLELVIGRLIVFFFGESFASAEGVARVLLIAAFFVGVRRVLGDSARGANRPLVGTVAEVTSWAVMIPAMVLLAPRLGLTGVAVALTIASASSLVVILVGVLRPTEDIPAQGRAGMRVPDVPLESRDLV